MKNLNPKIYLTCGFILLVGVILSLSVYFSLIESNNFKRDKLMSRIYNTVHDRVQIEIERNLNALHALRANYIAHDGMTRKSFGLYANYYTSGIKSIQALEWVPTILLEQRDSFELATRKEGYENFQISNIKNGKAVRAEEREVYYPVNYIEPFIGNEVALGFDPGKSSLIRQNAIDMAISTAKVAASDVNTIIQKTDPHKAILVFVPVYKSDSSVLGLVEGVFLMDQLIKAALSGISIPEGVEINISNNGEKTEILYGKAIASIVSGTNSRKGNLTIANRIWDLQIIFDGDAALSIINPVWILIAAISFTLLLVKVVYDILTDNRSALENNVRILMQKNRDLEQYAHVASHDLQEPLHSMHSLVELLYDEYYSQLDDAARQNLNYIKEASNRMSLLITNLLQHSQIGQVDQLEQVDCHQILLKVKMDMRQKMELTQTEIITERKLPIVKGYGIPLYLLFQNLIGNAIKFKKVDIAPIIEISYHLIEDKHIFIFKDNGIGIPKESLNQVFVIFKRLHNRSKYSGTGIGLANCKKIVEMHEGRIWVESELEKGSSFYFTLNLS